MNSKMEKLVWACRDVGEIKKITDEVVAQYSDYLRKGMWILRWCGKPILIRVSKVGFTYYHEWVKRFAKYNKKISNIKNYIQNCLSATWIYKCRENTGHDFVSDCVMISRNGYIYFYDLLTKTVVKHFTNSDNTSRYLELKGAGYWEYFSSPVLCVEGNTSKEKIIFENSSMLSNTDKYIFLLEQYKKYFSSQKPCCQIKVSEIVRQYEDFIPDFNKVFPSYVLDLQLDCYYQHGDFHSENVIFTDSKKAYIIDYELAGVYPLFYDILFWVWGEIWHQESWNLWNSICDDNSLVSKSLRSILTERDIPNDRNDLVRLMILTSILRLQVDINGTEKWSKRDLSNFFHMRVEKGIETLIKYYL